MKLTTISILALTVTAWTSADLRAAEAVQRAMFTGFQALPDTSAQTHARDREREERYAALECQNERIFAIVNYYEHGLFRLSWGLDDQVMDDDIPVMRHDWGIRETFTGKGIILDLPEKSPGSDMTPRIGALRVSNPIPKLWRGLRCVLHGAD